MTKANEHGVYEPEVIEELARRGRSYAAVEIAHCDDGLYRFALDMAYSYGGFCGPITDRTTGYATARIASEEATATLLGRFPKPWASEPQSVHDELRELRAMIGGEISRAVFVLATPPVRGFRGLPERPFTNQRKQFKIRGHATRCVALIRSTCVEKRSPRNAKTRL